LGSELTKSKKVNKRDPITTKMNSGWGIVSGAISARSLKSKTGKQTPILGSTMGATNNLYPDFFQ